MAVTQQMRDELAAAIAAGITRYTNSDGRQVQYATITEMLSALAFVDGELAGQQAAATDVPPLTTFAAISRD